MLCSTLTVAAALALFGFVSGEAEVALPESGNPQLYIFENQIHEALKNLSDSLAENDPALVSKINVNFENDLAKLNLEATDVILRGFSKFEATDLKISLIPPSARFTIQFDEIQLAVPYYNLDGLAVFVPLYGSGLLNVRATNISLSGSAKISLGIGSSLTGIKDLKLKFGLSEANLQISGLLHNEPLSQIVSTATTECFAEFVNTHGERLGELLGGILEDVINNVLNPPAEGESLDLLVPVKGSDVLKVGPYEVNFNYEL